MTLTVVSAGCHINDVMNITTSLINGMRVSAGCHINDVMNFECGATCLASVSAGCHINDVMNHDPQAYWYHLGFSWMSYQ